MLKNKYLKGATYERKIVNEQRALGRIAARSAGSKSCIDIFSVDFNSKEIRLIQCKTGKTYSDKTRKKLKDQLYYLEGEYKVIVEVLG